MIRGWRLNQNLLLIVKGMMPCCMYGSTVIHTPFNTTLIMKNLDASSASIRQQISQHVRPVYS